MVIDNAPQRLHVGDEEVEFTDRGDGEPILLVHANVFSDWFAPMAATAELEGFRLIRMRRAGYVAGCAPSAHLTLGDHARHCGQLLDALGIGTAHFCGHSSSSLIGLQLALDRPDAVASLVLLEPAPGGDLLGTPQETAIASIGRALAAFAAGDTAGGFDTFMRAVCGSHYRTVIEATLGPDGYQRAVEQSAFVPDEATAVFDWRFGPDEAARINTPMLIVEGGATARVASMRPESVELLAAMIPHAETAVLEGASHMMPLEDPRGVGRLVADFARRHAIQPVT